MCFKKSISGGSSIQIQYKCEQCLQWNFESTNKDLLSYPLPRNYPGNLVNDLPTKVTYESLIMLLRSTIFDFYKSHITLQECITKLKCHGINEELIVNVKQVLRNEIEGRTLKKD